MAEEEDQIDLHGSVWPAVFVAVMVLAALIGIGFVVLRVSRSAEAKANQENVDGERQQGPARQQPVPEATARGTAANRMQQRLRRRRDAAASGSADCQEERMVKYFNGCSGDARDAQDARSTGSIEEEANPTDDRDQQGAQQAAAREHNMTRQQNYDEKRRARDNAREAEEEALAAEIARLDAARLAEQDAEAAKWMGQIRCEEQGTGEEQSTKAEAQLADFVAFIKKHKTVPLDDLAAEFHMRTQDVINRIGELESDGRLTGVMDDRGKFIYISPSEMEAVAAFIHQRGRVAIAELAALSNEFIDLEVKPQPVEGDAPAARDLFDEDVAPSLSV